MVENYKTKQVANVQSQSVIRGSCYREDGVGSSFAQCLVRHINTCVHLTIAHERLLQYDHRRRLQRAWCVASGLTCALNNGLGQPVVQNVLADREKNDYRDRKHRDT